MDSTIYSHHEDLLPICTTVGYILNLLPQDVDPFDLSTTLESDHKYNFLKHTDPGEEITVPGSTRKYWPPENFEKHDTGSTTVTHSLICRTGMELASNLKVDSNVAANYFGFSAEASAGYEYSTNFKTTSLYGIYSLDQKNYSINVINKQTMYDPVEDEFIDATAKLPTWKTISKDLKDFDEVTSIYISYAKFYSRYGSHLIQEAYIGTRYQLKVEQNEATEEKMEEFSTNIKAEYQGAIGREEGSTDALLHIRVMEIGSFLKDSYVKSQLAVADRLSSAWSYFKDFYTFQGRMLVVFSFQGDVTKLEITPLPGLEIRVTGTDVFIVTQTKANSVEVITNKDCSLQYLNVTIVAPDRPVQLLFTQVLKVSSMLMGVLQLNQIGSARFRTIYTVSDASQNVRSFRDAHEPE
ncbi:hypothetical protein BPAE_0066g00400 [Botrytis paeoniae]|uniref:MACPF domain-containing protein n=1 Tax=Botrytis paeoniae TaxID=278948 RepID=A0A4Z1FML5_9HELO|nr:hypothetical protein BPAE_0066g00400 [Botrytis paeoniae]